MKKFVKITLSVIAVIIIVALGYVFFRLSVFDVGYVYLTDIQVEDDGITFICDNTNSGCYVKSYTYSVDDDGVLTIRFQGTMFEALAMKSSFGNITFKKPVHIKRIVLQSYDGSEKIIWQNSAI